MLQLARFYHVTGTVTALTLNLTPDYEQQQITMQSPLYREVQRISVD